MGKFLDNAGLQLVWKKMKSMVVGTGNIADGAVTDAKLAHPPIMLPAYMARVTSGSAPADVAQALGELATTAGYTRVRNQLTTGHNELYIGEAGKAQAFRVVYYNFPTISGSYFDLDLAFHNVSSCVYLTFRANVSGGNISSWLLYSRTVK